MTEIEERQVVAPADDDIRPTDVRERSAPGFVVAAGFALLVGIMAYFAFGMPGMDHGSDTAATSAMSGMGHDTDDDHAVGIESLTPDAFAARALDDGAFVVNVHVPFEGNIDGTDDHIPFDRIVGSAALPSDRATTILVYCRTGSMSAQAAEALLAAGYTDVAHLRGGMDAWQAAGMRVIGSD